MRTGEARLTCAHGVDLAPRHLVHAVGPRYVDRYTNAAGSALHWCYRHALQLCHEHNLRTVALLPLHDEAKKGYPSADGAHVALRTLRRFLERQPAAFDIILLLLVRRPRPLLEPLRRVARAPRDAPKTRWRDARGKRAPR